MANIVYGVTRGLMDDGGGDRLYFPYSRDWEDLDCNAETCLNNICKKCTVPSLAKIGEDGKCNGFKSKYKETPKIEINNPLNNIEI
jgi:hypothetical protein